MRLWLSSAHNVLQNQRHGYAKWKYIEAKMIKLQQHLSLVTHCREIMRMDIKRDKLKSLIIIML